MLGLFFQCSVAFAADNDARFAMKGAGFLPCQSFSKAREDRSNPYYMIGGWVEGYISAHNRYARDTYDILSFESLELLMSVIQNHCRSNPKDRLHGVLNGLLVSLMPDRLRAESPRVQITDGERQTALPVKPSEGSSHVCNSTASIEAPSTAATTKRPARR